VNGAEIGAIAGACAAAVVAPVVLKILTVTFPAKPASGTNQNIQELRAKFGRWDLAYAFLFMPTALPIIFAVWLILKSLATWHANLLPNADIKMTMMPIYWAIPALFISIWIAGYTCDGIYQVILGPRYGDFRHYRELRYKFDEYNAGAVGRIFLCITCLICGALVYIGLNFYFIVLPDEIVFRRLLTLTDAHYRYSDIRSIKSAPKYLAPNGKSIPRRTYVANLSDRTRISGLWLPEDLDPGQQARLMNALSQRSGVPIQELDRLSREDLGE
jgi:hypothetical protein